MQDRFYLAAPPQQPWMLSATALAEHLHRDFPDAWTNQAVSGHSGAVALDFSRTLGDGETYSASYEEPLDLDDIDQRGRGPSRRLGRKRRAPRE